MNAWPKIWKVADQPHDQVEEDVRRELRQRDVAELLPGVGAVQAGGLVELLCGMPFSPASQMIMPAAGAPQAHEDQRGLAPVGTLQPQRAPHAHRAAEHLVEQAALRVEDPDPQDAGGHHRHDRRQVEERPPDGDAANLQVQQQRHRQADGHAQRHADAS